jgi:hypothetical protein
MHKGGTELLGGRQGRHLERRLGRFVGDTEVPPAADGNRLDDVVPRIDRMDVATREDELCCGPTVCSILRLHGLISCHWDGVFLAILLTIKFCVITPQGQGRSRDYGIVIVADQSVVDHKKPLRPMAQGQ